MNMIMFIPYLYQAYQDWQFYIAYIPQVLEKVSLYIFTYLIYLSKYIYLPLLNILKLICLHNFGFQVFFKEETSVGCVNLLLAYTCGYIKRWANILPS
jgi:hypothetical protein